MTNAEVKLAFSSQKKNHKNMAVTNGNTQNNITEVVCMTLLISSSNLKHF